MGKDTPSPPPAPSPQAVGAANQQTALWNASLADVNQNTPLGSIHYTLDPNTGMHTDQAGYDAAVSAYNQQMQAPTQAQFTTNGVFDSRGYQNALRTFQHGSRNLKAPDISKYQTDTGKPPQYTSDINLSPEMQKLLQTTQGNQNALATTASGLMGQISDQASHPVDYSKFTPNPTMGDLGGISQSAQDAIMSRLNPQFDQQNEQMNSQLLNQGITPGSQAWDNAWRPVYQGQNDAREQAILNAGQEAQQMQGTALTSRNQQIQEAYQAQQAPINQYEALTGNTQVQMPTFSGAPSSSNPAAAAPPAGQALEQNYAQQMQNYNAQLASQNSMFGGLFSLGGQLGAAAIMA